MLKAVSVPVHHQAPSDVNGLKPVTQIANSLAVWCRGGGKRAVRKEQTAAGTRHVAGRT